MSLLTPMPLCPELSRASLNSRLASISCDGIVRVLGQLPRITLQKVNPMQMAKVGTQAHGPSVSRESHLSSRTTAGTLLQYCRFAGLVNSIRAAVPPAPALLVLLLFMGAVITVNAQTPGASVPFIEFNAATSSGVQTNGSVIGPNYFFGTLPSEADGRKAVKLVGQGQYISFTLSSPANAVDIHYAIPDSMAGGGFTAPINLYVNGSLVTSLSLTSKYSWLYGANPFSNTPSIGAPNNNVPHDFYNDVRYMFSSTLTSGSVVTLQVDSGDNSPWYVISTADFEQVAAPISQPTGYLNVTQSPYLADNTGAKDATTALQNAINDGSSKGQGVYIPEGTYTISSPLKVNNVTIEGAGEWYTVITGHHVEFSGNYNPASNNVNISNLAIFGNVTNRDNNDGTVNAFNGGFSNSNINNVWIQNAKVGAWIIGPTTNLTLDSLRILDTTADGINFYANYGEITSSTVKNSFLRNTQDDGLALWSSAYENANITLTQNTIDSPGLANNIAVYGSGDGVQITNNLLQDTITRGGGINIGRRYNSVAMNGTLTISGNKLVSTAQFDPGWAWAVGGIWFYPQQGNMNSTINISGNTNQDSAFEAYEMAPSGKAYTISNVSITNDTISNPGTFVFQLQNPGSATVSGTTASGVGVAGIYNCNSGFTISQGSGNSGWSTSHCGYPTTWPLWTYTDFVTFENATVGQAAPVQQIAVDNTASASATLSGFNTTSGFTASKPGTSGCGTSLAATSVSSSYCLENITFTPQTSGITAGTLSIASSETGSPNVIQLIGTTSTMSETPTSLSFGTITAGSTSSTQTVTVTNNGTTSATLRGISASSDLVPSGATKAAFNETTTCGSSLAVGASCTVSLTFSPAISGSYSGTLAIDYPYATSPELTIPLSGTAR